MIDRGWLKYGLLVWFLPATFLFPSGRAADFRDESVRDRLWIWGHPAGVYNDSYLRPLGRKSIIEPVAAAQWMGLNNMIFVRYDGKPPVPFDAYYTPFRKLHRVYWSLVGAGGGTSGVEREAAFALAEKNDNLVGFILDDFFHEPGPGNASDPLPRPVWLADNQPRFPVILRVSPPRPISCTGVELVQTDWPSGDYRARDVALDLSVDGKTWKQTARGTIPNRPGAILRLPLPQTPFTGFQLRFLNTHDRQAALSVGLSRVQFLSAGRIIETSDWKAEASSSYSGFSPGALLAGVKSPELPFRASLSPGELRALQQRRVRGKKLPILGVIYTRQVKSGARSHIAEIDQLCLWTWRPVDLKNLEANFQALEKLAPDKKLFLGCYMYDFNENKPMPVALMKGQVELAYRWLKEGRISGMIFLATPNVDVGLEAVDWTRRWIQEQGDRKLPSSQ